MIEKKAIKDIEIYKDYLIAKYDKKITLLSVAKKHNLSRDGLYRFITRLENGNVSKIKKELKKVKMEIYMKHKYGLRLMAIGANRKADTVIELRKLIREMDSDGFGTTEIAVMCGKDRATILHHLRK